MGTVLGSAIRGAWPLLIINSTPCILIIGIVTIYNVLVSAGTSSNQHAEAVLDVSVAVGGLLGAINYFAMAAATRTVKADFRMTFAIWFRVFGFNLLASLLCYLAALAFVIPGFWIGVKLALMPYAYCLEPQADQVARTWKMTTGHYWETFGIIVASGLMVIFPLVVSAGIGVLWHPTPFAGIFLFSICFTAFAWGIHVQALAMIQWTESLIRRIALPN